MAQADWTFGTDSGSYSILTDGTSPGTNTSVLDFQGALGAGNSTVGNELNASIEAYIKPQAYIPSSNSGYGFLLRGSSYGDTSQSKSYRFFIKINGSNFDVLIQSQGPTFGTLTLVSSSGVAPLTGTNSDWQKWRASAISVGGATTYLRLELWNGASYTPVLDVADGNTDLIAFSGTINFVSAGGNPSNHIRFDDVKIYTLA